MKQVLKLCRECRTELKEHGYNLREDEILPESIEDCELCGRRTGVKPAWVKDAAEMARRLGCSLELAMGLPEARTTVQVPQPKAEEPEDWLTGNPPEGAEGWYAAKVRMFKETLPAPRVFWWDGET